MEKKYSLILDKEFIQFCELNNIKDVEKYAKEIFNKSFMEIKYGKIPKIKITDRIQEIKTEVIREGGVAEIVVAMENKKLKKDIYDE